MLRLVVLVLVSSAAVAGAENLGKIDFPVTGSPAAQARFDRGVMALHSFFYDEALEEFRAATAAEPGFAMGFWGEAMALNHTIWHHQDTAAGRKVLARIGDTGKLRPNERAFIDAVRVLYGPGDDKPARDVAYAAAMERFAAEARDDLEAQSFHALAILGSLDSRQPGLAPRMRAGAIALDVLARNPDHPGAAHYAIHAFDDADHAVIALPAARRYAQIAPAAFHARHMPSHIFVNLGMWEEAAAACESAWKASDEWVARRGHMKTRRDYHSLSWLVSIYHQQGRLKKAEETLAMIEDTARRWPNPGAQRIFVTMAASLADRRRRLDRIEPILALAPGTTAGPSTEAGCHAPAGMSSEREAGFVLALNVAEIRARSAAGRGDEKEARKQLEVTAEQRKLLAGTAGWYDMEARAPVVQLEVEARLLAAGKRWPEAAARLRDAITLEMKDPFRGSADPSGDALETHLGDVLLVAGKPLEAARAYADALRVTPGDSLALLGAARAARASGDARGATAFYRRLAAQWRNADADLPELAEVQAGAR